MPTNDRNVKKSFRISHQLGKKAEDVAARTLRTESDLYRLAVEKYLSPDPADSAFNGSGDIMLEIRNVQNGQADISKFMRDVTSALRALNVRIDHFEKNYQTDALRTVEAVARQADATREVQEQTTTAVVDAVEKLNSRFNAMLDILKRNSK